MCCHQKNADTDFDNDSKRNCCILNAKLFWFFVPSGLKKKNFKAFLSTNQLILCFFRHSSVQKLFSSLSFPSGERCNELKISAALPELER